MKTELLAPAGSMEALKAAVSAGADAVYLGGAAFGARAYAKNLDEQEILSAIDYVHLRNRKLYLTVNTLLKEEELEEKLYPYLRPYYEQGLDAVIVQDMGVLKAVLLVPGSRHSCEHTDDSDRICGSAFPGEPWRDACGTGP